MVAARHRITRDPKPDMRRMDEVRVTKGALNLLAGLAQVASHVAKGAPPPQVGSNLLKTGSDFPPKRRGRRGPSLRKGPRPSGGLPPERMLNAGPAPLAAAE